MPEWVVETGLGETRSALIADGEILEARIRLDGIVPAGSLVEARLASVGDQGRNAVAVDCEGREYLLPRRPPGIAEGATLSIEVTRESIPGREDWKRPLARAAGDVGDVGTAPASADEVEERHLAFPPGAQDVLGEAGWEDLLDEARSGSVRFAGGSLGIFLTPAMTLIDVDGSLPPERLCVEGAAAAARAVRRLAIGGSIGIDLPTVAGKAHRIAAAQAFDAHMAGPFERTAVNGFGFLQVVRPRRHASLVEIFSDRANAEARALLRRVGATCRGRVRICAHPAVIRALEDKPQWIAQVSRQTGGEIGLRADPSRPMSGGHDEPF